jgi:hypothetical protein
MKAAEEIGTLCRVATARMPTKWGMFNAAGFARQAPNGNQRSDTALAMVMGDLRRQVPLLRIHSQCFTGESLGSPRCDCSDQLSTAMRAIAAERHGLAIYEYQSCPGVQSGLQGLQLAGCDPARARRPPCSPSDEQSRQGACLDRCRHRSGRPNSVRGEGESTRVALDLSLIKRRADYVNH